MAVLDWCEFEEELFSELEFALEKLGKASKAETFYAVALYHVYRELDGTLSFPMLAAAAAVEAEAVSGEPGDFWDERYNPHGWSHAEVLLRHKPALRLDRALTAEACSGSQAHWRKTEARYFKLLTRVTRRLREIALKRLRTTPDFIVFWHDEEGGPELARKTIPKPIFERVFKQNVADKAARAKVSRLPEAERAAELVSRLGRHDAAPTSEDAQRELLALGAVAIPALLQAVTDKQQGWLVAKLLGTIGVASEPVLAALRHSAPESRWHATALGMLGDLPWAVQSNNVGVAVAALTANLKAISSEGRRVRLDYAPLEAYLATATPKATALIEKELEPGTSYAEIAASDVDEALRGLASKHPVVRWHAASRLGERGLGAPLAKRILPALAHGLQDKHHLVRRLSVLAISYWKAAAAPYRDAVAARMDDRNEAVRRMAASVTASWK